MGTTTVSLSWLDSGEPVTLGPLPIAGQREMEQIKDDFAAEATVEFNAYLLYLRGAILQTKRLLDTKGVEEARRVWDEGLGSQFANLKWEADSFEKNLEAWYQEFVVDGLSKPDRPVGTYEQAKVALEAEASAVNKDWQERHSAIFDFRVRLKSSELYWRLLKADPRPRITAPGADPVPLPTGKTEAIAAIESWLDEDEWLRIQRALRGVPEDAPDDEKPELDATLKLRTEGEMRGKSGADSPPSTPPSAASAPSSEPSTETTTP